MSKFIVKVSTKKGLHSLDPIGKRGKPRALHDIFVLDSDLTKDQILAIDGVDTVEEESFDDPDEIQYSPRSWFLPSASNTAPNYTYTRTGKGVSIYVMDSGIRTTHQDFAGRVIETVFSYDGLDYGGDVRSPNHGTMAASCAAGTIYGIAKEANIYNARYNWSNTEGIKALDSILAHYRENNAPAILSMSFSSTSSIYLHALDKLVKEGMVLVASASNSGEPQPRWPARRDDVIAVAACDQKLAPSVWSSTQSTNYGKEVDIWAGGSGGRAASYVSDVSEGSASGTSSACPLVAGNIALILEGSKKLESYSQVEYVKQKLIENSRKDVIKYPDDRYAETPNRYIYTLTTNDVIPIDPPEAKHKSGTITDNIGLIIIGIALVVAVIFLL